MDTIGSENQKAVLLRLLRYAMPHKKLISVAFSFLFLTTLGDIIGPMIVKVFIDDYLTPKNIIMGPIIAMAVAYLAIDISKTFIMYQQLFIFQKIALKIIQTLRIDVFAKVEQLGMSYFDRTPAGATVSRVTNDTEAIKDMFVSVIASFIQSFVYMIGIMIAMFFLNAKLALVCLVIFPIIIFLIQLYRRLSSKFYHEMRERLSQLNAKLNESLQGMTIIQLFRQEERLRKEFDVINKQHYEAGMRNMKLDGLMLRPAINLIHTTGLMIILTYFGITSLNTSIEIGVVYAFVNYLSRLVDPVNQIMQRLSLYQQAIVAGTRVFAIMDETEVTPGLYQQAKAEIKTGTVEFKNLSFSYDGQRDVLKNISFKANKGETVALVGHTGSGKSSIINLLMRFYEYERGEILIDGQSIKEYSNPELRHKMGLVLQDPFLFYGTIKDNIRLHNETITDEEIEHAARFVQADTFIQKLPDQYNHRVVERGSTFSSGQRQLIAFARTIVTNPAILILDEATANIDTETEEAIQQSLKKMREGRTTIAIAHRLSTIQDANLILVLHKGEIVERGTHQQLLSLKGLYYKMFLLQNGISEKKQDIVM